MLKLPPMPSFPSGSAAYHGEGGATPPTDSKSNLLTPGGGRPCAIQGRQPDRDKDSKRDTDKLDDRVQEVPEDDFEDPAQDPTGENEEEDEEEDGGTKPDVPLPPGRPRAAFLVG